MKLPGRPSASSLRHVQARILPGATQTNRVGLSGATDPVVAALPQPPAASSVAALKLVYPMLFTNLKPPADISQIVPFLKKGVNR